MADQMELQLIFELLDNSSKDLQNIAKGLDKVKKNYDSAKKSEEGLEKQTKKTTSIFKKQFNVLNTPLAKLASIGAITGVLGVAAKKSMEFSDGLAEVATLTSKSAKEIENSFKPIVHQIQRTYGKDSQDVIKSLYDGISAGIPATNEATSKYLEAVAKMSIGGRASMEDSGDLLTTIMNAWNHTGITAEQAGNSMFGAVKMGKTTISQLAQSMGQIANDASVAGASVQETSAAIAALTTIGIKTPETMTKLRGLMKSLVAPAEGAAKAFSNLGIKSIGGMMQSFKDNKFLNTLQEVDKRIRKTTKTQDEYNKAVAKLFPDREAASAFTALMTTANNAFNESLKETAINAGQVSTAFNKMQTDGLAIKQAYAELDIAVQSIGDVLVPYLAKSAKGVSEIFKNIKMIVDNAAHIESLNQEEKQKQAIKNENMNTVDAGIDEMMRRAERSGRWITDEDIAKEEKNLKRIIEVRIESAGIKEADKKTSGQIAAELLPELKKYLKEEQNEKNRKGLGKVPVMMRNK
jgi:TP901 family phage tail tape measure protein